MNLKVEAPKTEQTTAMTNETRILLFDVEIVVAPHVVLIINCVKLCLK